MALNRVGIDGHNYPKLTPYEPILHSFPSVQFQLVWGGGYPGVGGNVNAPGQLYLTPFRLIFVPKAPCEKFFSVVVPLNNMDKVSTDIKTYSNPDTSGARDYMDPESIPLRLRAENGSYETSKGPSSFYIKANVRPLSNTITSAVDEARDFLGMKPMPSSSFLTTGLVNSLAKLTITFPRSTHCSVHHQGFKLQQSGSGAIITCHLPDLLFSFIKAYNTVRKLHNLPMMAAPRLPEARAPRGYTELSDMTTSDLDGDEAQTGLPRNIHPHAPIMLGYAATTHSMQDMSIYDAMARNLRLSVFDVYNESSSLHPAYMEQQPGVPPSYQESVATYAYGQEMGRSVLREVTGGESRPNADYMQSTPSESTRRSNGGSSSSSSSSNTQSSGHQNEQRGADEDGPLLFSTGQRDPADKDISPPPYQ